MAENGGRSDKVQGRVSGRGDATVDTESVNSFLLGHAYDGTLAEVAAGRSSKRQTLDEAEHGRALQCLRSPAPTQDVQRRAPPGRIVKLVASNRAYTAG